MIKLSLDYHDHRQFETLANPHAQTLGCMVFSYRLAGPERYSVVDYFPEGSVRTSIKKPADPPSHVAVTRRHFLKDTPPDGAAKITPH